VKGWKADGGIGPGGDVGGDCQAGEAYDVRFFHPKMHGALVTAYAYAAEYDRNPGEFLVQVQTEFMICRDPADPGGTEEWSDATYQDEDRTWDTLAGADKAARETGGKILRSAGRVEWDGNPADQRDLLECVPWTRGGAAW
jgi:hypothetical protein